MAQSPFYKQCALTGTTNEKIDWHHNLIYAGRQVNEPFCIIPLATSIHDKISTYKELVDWVMVNRATDAELSRYSKAVDYHQLKATLNKKYGDYTPRRAKEHTELLQKRL